MAYRWLILCRLPLSRSNPKQDHCSRLARSHFFNCFFLSLSLCFQYSFLPSSHKLLDFFALIKQLVHGDLSSATRQVWSWSVSMLCFVVCERANECSTWWEFVRIQYRDSRTKLEPRVSWSSTLVVSSSRLTPHIESELLHISHRRRSVGRLAPFCLRFRCAPPRMFRAAWSVFFLVRFVCSLLPLISGVCNTIHFAGAPIWESFIPFIQSMTTHIFSTLEEWEEESAEWLFWECVCVCMSDYSFPTETPFADLFRDLSFWPTLFQVFHPPPPDLHSRTITRIINISVQLGLLLLIIIL